MAYTKEQAWELLTQYNKGEFHLKHANTVADVMRWYAEKLGYGDEADFWATVGLLHDIDFEQWPEQHCQKAPELLLRWPRFRLTNERNWKDYLYRAEDMAAFAGRKYSGQRNHINKFRKLYPDAAFRPLGKSDLPLITQFFRDYEAVFTKASDSAKNELHFLVGGMELDGRLLSVAMAERCGDTLQIHIEKALYGYEGVYPAKLF